MLLKYILSFFHLESFPLFLCSAPTWDDLHGSSSIGTIICAVLCGLMWNDWGVQVYLSFAVWFTFFLSSLLSVCSFILGSLLYFSYYLRDNCCNAYIVWRPTGWEINTSCQPNAARMLLSAVSSTNLNICLFCLDSGWWIKSIIYSIYISCGLWIVCWTDFVIPFLKTCCLLFTADVSNKVEF